MYIQNTHKPCIHTIETFFDFPSHKDFHLNGGGALIHAWWTLDKYSMVIDYCNFKLHSFQIYNFVSFSATPMSTHTSISTTMPTNVPTRISTTMPTSALSQYARALSG